MNKLIFFITCFAVATVMHAQNNATQFTPPAPDKQVTQDPDAQKILDDMAAKMKSFPSILMGFTYTMENQQQKNKFTQKGSVVIKGNKYKITLPDSDIYFDGKDQYNYVKEAKEVTISTPKDKQNDFFLNNPTKLFTMYKDDYKYRLVQEGVINGISFYEIHLVPFDLKKGFSRVKLRINKTNSQIFWAQVIGKTGEKFTIDFTSFDTKKVFTDDYFSFNVKKNPKVQVIDTRGL